jgi:hypothetical protein
MKTLLVRYLRKYEKIIQKNSEGETKGYTVVFVLFKHPIEFLVSGEYFLLTDRFKLDSGAGF